MPVILEVKPNPKKPEQAYVKIEGQAKDAWCPSFDAVKDLVGKPLPEGWNVTEGDYGPRLLPPKDRKGGFGGGAAAFRNTREGQAIEQERMDRRTALMQAITHAQGHGTENSDVLFNADMFYAWLRKTAGGTAAPAAGAGTPSSPSTSPPVPAPSSAPAGTSQPSGSVSEGPGADTSGGGQSSDGKADGCLHRMTVKTNPAGHPLPAGFERCADCGTTWRVT